MTNQKQIKLIYVTIDGKNKMKKIVKKHVNPLLNLNLFINIVLTLIFEVIKKYVLTNISKYSRYIKST